MEYKSLADLKQLSENEDIPLWEVILQQEISEEETTREQITARIEEQLEVMESAIRKGKENSLESPGGLSGGDARKLVDSEFDLSCDLNKKAAEAALAIAEVNAGMGKIVAGPTAGASGIVPAVVVSLAREYNFSRKKQIRGILTAAGLGKIAARTATLSGAAGGCQAECGVGSGMAAGAAVAMFENNSRKIIHGFALAVKNLLGLVCDPVAGLVEVPCVKRNAFAATHSLTAANLALAGIESVIPPDEVIAAMGQIGDLLPASLKETAEAGLAATETGRKIEQDISGQD